MRSRSISFLGWALNYKFTYSYSYNIVCDVCILSVAFLQNSTCFIIEDSFDCIYNIVVYSWIRLQVFAYVGLLVLHCSVKSVSSRVKWPAMRRCFHSHCAGLCSHCECLVKQKLHFWAFLCLFRAWTTSDWQDGQHLTGCIEICVTMFVLISCLCWLSILLIDMHCRRHSLHIVRGEVILFCICLLCQQFSMHI